MQLSSLLVHLQPTEQKVSILLLKCYWAKTFQQIGRPATTGPFRPFKKSDTNNAKAVDTILTYNILIKLPYDHWAFLLTNIPRANRRILLFWSYWTKTYYVLIKPAHYTSGGPFLLFAITDKANDAYIILILYLRESSLLPGAVNGAKTAYTIILILLNQDLSVYRLTYR